MEDADQGYLRVPPGGVICRFSCGHRFLGRFQLEPGANQHRVVLHLVSRDEESMSTRSIERAPIYNNRTGVRASCPDCHVPKEWVHKVVRKVRATNELFHWLEGVHRHPGGLQGQAARAGAARVGEHGGDRLAGMPKLSRIGFMNRDSQAVQARTMHEAGGQVGNDLYRMPPGNRSFLAAGLRQGRRDGRGCMTEWRRRRWIAACVTRAWRGRRPAMAGISRAPPRAEGVKRVWRRRQGGQHVRSQVHDFRIGGLGIAGSSAIPLTLKRRLPRRWRTARRCSMRTARSAIRKTRSASRAWHRRSPIRSS